MLTSGSGKTYWERVFGGANVPDAVVLQKKIPYDYYKEIIGNYRKRIHKMDFGMIGEYASKFKSNKRIMDTISREVL